MKWSKLFLSNLPKPLGRWSQCGEKMTVSDVLEFKSRQKARRQWLLETGTDPYHAAVHPLKPVGHHPVDTEDYMRPFVIQS